MTIRTMIPILLLGGLTGCGETPTGELGAAARPVKSMVIDLPQGSGIRNFPGRIDSANKADLAFRVSGTVAELLVGEGEQVTRNQRLAQLEQTDFQITLKDRQATWDRTDKDYARAKELIEEGAISRRDYDAVEANFKSADAALEQARQNLEYTNLRAPFEGSIAERHIERFEEVATGQNILSIIDMSSLLVKFDIPENIILLLPKADSDEERGANVNVWASFEGAGDRRFELTFKEAAARADAQTQTFEVTFSLPAPDDFTVLPGMTASVQVDLSRAIDERVVYYVPIAAVTGDNELTPRIWAVDENTMTVHERPVTLGRMVGSSIEVTEGLEPGVRIITAGAAYLAEGMQVRLMKETEQAEPRENSAS